MEIIFYYILSLHKILYNTNLIKLDKDLIRGGLNHIGVHTGSRRDAEHDMESPMEPTNF